jgi:regulator of protease activity HflC (stomatin/prohibitin superfamily)
VVGVLLVIGLVFAMMLGIPKYRVWQRALSGEAQLREAEWNRKIAVQEAEAKMEAAKHLACAEIERAKGVAEANKIIGQSLKDNDAYLRYLWLQGLHDGSSEVIYVPTEGNLPILEAGKR